MKVGAFKRQEINKLVKRGLTYRRIAQRLGIPLVLFIIILLQKLNRIKE